MSGIRGFLSEMSLLANIHTGDTAETTTITSSAVDMAGYDGCLLITRFATANSGNLCKVQQSSDDGGSDAYADLTGTSTASGSSDEVVFVDIQRPKERYLKFLAVRAGASTALGSMYAVRYNARSVAVDNTTSGTITGEAHLSPAEGTA